MLISICGAQGSGKSTLIQGLLQSPDLNITPKVIERKTARSILSDWGLTLQQVYEDPQLITKFQDELLERKFQDEFEAANSDELWITERTYIDLLAYTVANVGRFNQYSDWLNTYAQRCNELQSTYNLILYLPSGKFTIQDDGVRPKNPVYGIMIDTFIRNQLESSQSTFHVVGETIIDKRTQECALKIMEQVYNK